MVYKCFDKKTSGGAGESEIMSNQERISRKITQTNSQKTNSYTLNMNTNDEYIYKQI